jgi:hypothetical protein
MCLRVSGNELQPVLYMERAVSGTTTLIVHAEMYIVCKNNCEIIAAKGFRLSSWKVSLIYLESSYPL